MAQKIVLDAMIRRADFWQLDHEKSQELQDSSTNMRSITFENLRGESSFVLNLRKPDFQRETNQWGPSQVVGFIQSFLDGELVPSVILWLSREGFIFAIDGAHRLSALRAWIEDDYGDGKESIAFFGGEIPAEQKKSARRLRDMIEKKVGSYKMLKDLERARKENPALTITAEQTKRLKNFGTRNLDLQWVGGDADVAEGSFFKINTQGTPLDKTEQELLRNRKRPPAIAARSIVRAATGHKYWSKFDDIKQKEIERRAQELNVLLFRPELDPPIKTLQLPIGGSGSTLDGLSLLMKLLSITESTAKRKRPSISQFEEDPDGSETISVLQNCLRVVERITGNDEGSLGLHPVVYFYSERGTYMNDMFLGFAYLLKQKMLDNDKGFFKKFTDTRAKLEEFIVSNKALISQMMVQINSRNRIDRVGDIFRYLVSELSEAKKPTIEGVAAAAKLKGSIVSLREKVEGKNFTDEGKSHMYLKPALQAALRCPICKGFMEPAISASYDHIERKQDGGTGDESNGQLTHPYCNTGYKN